MRFMMIHSRPTTGSLQRLTRSVSQRCPAFLEARTDLVVKEKVYGVHPEKADKVIAAFAMFERNLGVILSGDKGIGKSLLPESFPQRRLRPGILSLLLTSSSRVSLPILSPSTRRLSSCLTSSTRPLAVSGQEKMKQIRSLGFEPV